MRTATISKKGKEKPSEEVEKICLSKFDFSIGELNELYDVMDDCDGARKLWGLHCVKTI